MKRFLKEDIERSLQIMGLPIDVSDFLVEALSSAATGNPIIQLADILKSAMRKGSVELLNEEEQLALRIFNGEIKYMDNTLDLGEIGEKLTKEQLSLLKRSFSEYGTSIKFYLSAAALRLASAKVTSQILTNETILKNTFEELGENVEEFNNFLRQMETSSWYDETITTFEREETTAYMRGVANMLEDENPYKKMILNACDDADDKLLRHMETGFYNGTVASDLETVTDDIVKNLEEVAETGERNIEEIIINPNIYDDLADETDTEVAQTLEDAAKKTFMEDMKKNCSTAFCRTMVAYYEGGSEKFEIMWKIIVKELEGKAAKVTQAGMNDTYIPKDIQEIYQSVLTTYKKYNSIMTPDQYSKFGEAIYKKWNEVGFLSKFSLKGLFGNTPNAFYVIGRTMVGSDIYTGKFSFAAMRKKWVWFNLVFLIGSVGKTAYDITLGTDDPNQDKWDLIKQRAASTFKNIVYTGFGLAPAYRITLEILINGFEASLPESRYVNREELLKFLKEQSKSTNPPGWTDLEVYENIFNKKGVQVYFGVNDDPEFTQIKGITDPLYISANGRYQYVKSGDFVYKLKFIPEGQTKPKETEVVKSLKVEKDVINNIEDVIATSSVLSPLIKDRLTGIIKNHKKHLDYKEQKIMTDDEGKQNSILIFEWKDKDTDISYKFAFNYTKYKSMNSPDLKTQENWAQLVKEYK